MSKNNNYISNLLNIDFSKLSDEQLNKLINDNSNQVKATGTMRAAGYTLPVDKVCKVLVKGIEVDTYSDNFRINLVCEHNKQDLYIGFSATSKTIIKFTEQFVSIFNLNRNLTPNQLIDEITKALKANQKGFYILVKRERFNNGNAGTWYNFEYDALLHEFIKEQALSVMQKRTEKKGE